MNACASKEAARTQNQLNRVYGKLLTSAATQPKATMKIKMSEKAWITYRDAYLEAMYPAADKLAEYGTIYPMEADLLRSQLTTEHTADLKVLLQQYDGRRN
jgi:uncharacterized protein YecT (DUF1311 family)